MLHSQEQKRLFEWLSVSMDVLLHTKCAPNTLVPLPVQSDVFVSACKNDCVCYNVERLLGVITMACLCSISIHIRSNKDNSTIPNAIQRRSASTGVSPRTLHYALKSTYVRSSCTAPCHMLLELHNDFA